MKSMRTSETFFNQEEKNRISATVRNVESRTIGEVAVMVVDSSGKYLEVEVIGGILSGSLLAFIVAAFFFHFSLWAYIPLSFLLFFPFRYLFRTTPQLKAALIGYQRREETVRERALRAFYEKNLHNTKDCTGVLFFISLLERKVWVLADKGIHEKIGQETLNTFALSVSQGIRNGRSCDALCESMQKAGELLARHFPKTPGDTNELPNEIITQ